MAQLVNSVSDFSPPVVGKLSCRNVIRNNYGVQLFYQMIAVVA